MDNPDNDKNYSLPEYGFFTHMPQSGKQSSSVWINGSRLDEVYSKNLYYLNTHGKQIEGKCVVMDITFEEGKFLGN